MKKVFLTILVSSFLLTSTPATAQNMVQQESVPVMKTMQTGNYTGFFDK